jgi:hypothetical protein
VPAWSAHAPAANHRLQQAGLTKKRAESTQAAHGGHGPHSRRTLPNFVYGGTIRPSTSGCYFEPPSPQINPANIVALPNAPGRYYVPEDAARRSGARRQPKHRDGRQRRDGQRPRKRQRQREWTGRN